MAIAPGPGKSTQRGTVLTADQLPDTSPPAAHDTSHENGGSDEINVAGLSGVLADPQTPAAHSILSHTGFPGGTTDFLRADGSFQSPGASSTNIKQTEVDFGSTPIPEQSFTITDAAVSLSNQLIAMIAYEAPTGKDLDELEMDAIDIKVAPGTGEFTLFIKGLEGYLHDKFKVNYLIG